MGKHLDKELENVKAKLLALSSLVERNLKLSILAVKEFDALSAEKVNKFDFEIDLMEVEIEEDCLKTLALYQPVARDLRFLIVALKINNDLERIGDLAVNLGSRAKYLTNLARVGVPFDFENMAQKTMNMLKMSIDSLVNLNVEQAKDVCRLDDEVDDINKQMYQEVFSSIKKNPECTEQLIHYLTISRVLERIADYSTNIAEDVIYMIDGVIVRHSQRNSDCAPSSR